MLQCTRPAAECAREGEGVGGMRGRERSERRTGGPRGALEELAALAGCAGWGLESGALRYFTLKWFLKEN